MLDVFLYSGFFRFPNPLIYYQMPYQALLGSFRKQYDRPKRKIWHKYWQKGTKRRTHLYRYILLW